MECGFCLGEGLTHFSVSPSMGFCGVFGIWFLLSQGLLCQFCLAGALDPWGIDGLGERLWQLMSEGFVQDWTIEFPKLRVAIN